MNKKWIYTVEIAFCIQVKFQNNANNLQNFVYD